MAKVAQHVPGRSEDKENSAKNAHMVRACLLIRAAASTEVRAACDGFLRMRSRLGCCGGAWPSSNFMLLKALTTPVGQTISCGRTLYMPPTKARGTCMCSNRGQA
jgi:hypothetical protein